MRRTLSLAMTSVLALSALVMPAMAGVDKYRAKNQAAGSSHAIILQNQADGKTTAKAKQLPPDPCKNKTACR
jgi:hypothetical protein